MKRLIFSLSLISAALFIGGCGDSEYDDGGYTDAYPGIYMYSAATYANSLSLDGVSVAMRFAVLQAEMANLDTPLEFEANSSGEPDWDKLEDMDYSGVEIGIREFLFRDMDNSKIYYRDNNLYTIEYTTSDGAHTSGYLESNYRVGTYQIDTKGVTLEQATESNPWEIAIYDDPDNEDDDDNYITFSDQDSREATIKVTSTVIKMWFNETTRAFEYDLTSKMHYSGYASYSSSSWSMAGNLAVTNYNTLLISDTLGRDYQLSVDSASGLTLSGIELTYKTTTPLQYNYTLLPYTAVNGVAVITINTVDTDSYPSSSVTVTTDANGYQAFQYGDYYYSYY